MFKVTLNGKTYECEVNVSGRYDDDIQISDLTAYQNDIEVTDELIIEALCEKIYESYSDALYELWYDNKVCEAEYYADGLEDR